MAERKTSVDFVSQLTEQPSQRLVSPLGQSSDTSQALLYFSTPSGHSHESYDLIDKFKMKEIKQYIANELFRSQKKTQSLYAEFNRLKALKQSINEVTEQ